jgi:hypothetical protein
VRPAGDPALRANDCHLFRSRVDPQQRPTHNARRPDKEVSLAEGEATTEERESGGAEAPAGGAASFIAGDPPAPAPLPKTDRLAALAAKPKPWLQRAAEVRAGGPVMRSIDDTMTTPAPDSTPPEPPAEPAGATSSPAEPEERSAAPAPPRPVESIDLTARTATPPTPGTPLIGDLSKLEEVCQHILEELRHRDEPAVGDFSVSKLLAGIVQVLSLAALFYAYLRSSRNDPAAFETLLLAIALQTLTIALLIMGRQK